MLAPIQVSAGAGRMAKSKWAPQQLASKQAEFWVSQWKTQELGSYVHNLM
jgi:hypothetical protein